MRSLLKMVSFVISCASVNYSLFCLYHRKQDYVLTLVAEMMVLMLFCIESSHVGDLSTVNLCVCVWVVIMCLRVVDDVTYSALCKRLKYEEEGFYSGLKHECAFPEWSCCCSASNRAVMWAEEQC